MLTAFIILFFIFGGLGIYAFYSTRYFNDLYGASSILTSRQSVFIDKRFSPLNFTFTILNITIVLVALVLFSFAIFQIGWNSQSGVLFSLAFILVSIILFSLPFSELIIQKKLKEINNYEYIFDPADKSLEVVGGIKFNYKDIQSIENIGIGRDMPLKKIILKSGEIVILSKYLPCFDVIQEFFGSGIPTTYQKHNMIVFAKELLSPPQT